MNKLFEAIDRLESFTLNELEDLKETFLGSVLDAAYSAADASGSEPDWDSIISSMLNKISDANFERYLKVIGMEEEDFYEGLPDADPEDVINGLEDYLSKDDIKEIIDNFSQSNSKKVKKSPTKAVKYQKEISEKIGREVDLELCKALVDCMSETGKSFDPKMVDLIDRINWEKRKNSLWELSTYNCAITPKIYETVLPLVNKSMDVWELRKHLIAADEDNR